MYAEIRKVLSHFRRSLLALGEVNDYCKFMQYTGSNVNSIDKICSGKKYLKVEKECDETLGEEVGVIMKFLSWSEENLEINSGRVRDLADHINRWNQRADRYNTREEDGTK